MLQKNFTIKVLNLDEKLTILGESRYISTILGKRVTVLNDLHNHPEVVCISNDDETEKILDKLFNHIIPEFPIRISKVFGPEHKNTAYRIYPLGSINGIYDVVIDDADELLDKKKFDNELAKIISTIKGWVRDNPRA